MRTSYIVHRIFDRRGSLYSKTAFLLIMLCSFLFADTGGTVQGKVTTEQGTALAGVNIYLKGTNLGTTTNAAGEFRLTDIPPGNYTLVAEFIGRKSQEKTFQLQDREVVEMTLILPVEPIYLSGIVVTTSRWGEITEQLSHLPAKTIQRVPARVTGELLRTIPGVDAVRRGPVGLDPVVRGLRETEVGTYVDGTRYFPGGPARMDSPLSHFDPSAIYRIRVIKGPYALTLGAGNLSAVQAESYPLPWEEPGKIHGRFSTGYYSNLQAPEAVLSLRGSSGGVAFWTHANWRQSSDYLSGNGETVPGDYHSREFRGKLGFRLTPHSRLIFSGGYQYQNDIDYPGRLLNARFFRVYNANIRYRFQQSEGAIRSVEIMGYVNNVDHEMDNTGKPTAEPNPNRMPPFPLLVEVTTGANVKGGRIAVEMIPKEKWKINLGGDLYRANRDARRNISRRDNGMVMMKDDIVWPDATITDGGIFAQVGHSLTPRMRLTGTVRLDFVHAGADTASEFFLENISRDLDHTETNFSGALMIESSINRHWVIAAGAGSAVRTADANERYSDRFPASKAQTSAEFMGNPAIKPERSNQVDVWVEAAYPYFSLQLNGFYRRIDNFITLQPTDFPKKLPLSPDIVFQYINGEAEFWGGEAAVRYHPTNMLSLNATVEYLWGNDNTLDEPALGIPPVKGSLGIRLQSNDEKLSVYAAVHLAGKQTRVAQTRGEIPTEGYVTGDLQASLRMGKIFEVNLGIINLTNRQYINHLNAKNPFTGNPVPEPGRQFFARLTLYH
ncbi:MAG: TonB-dependent receptor [Calditrichaeota bacterium]|nr:MAG: TonB-dependent receptor [Calditrichota bacterium]